MRYYLTEDQYAWAEPRLRAYGALMGGPIAERAEITDKHLRSSCGTTAGGMRSAK